MGPAPVQDDRSWAIERGHLRAEAMSASRQGLAATTQMPQGLKNACIYTIIWPMASTAHTEPPSAGGCTCFKLRRLTRRVTAVYDRALAPAGMRVTQYSVLSQLRRLRGASMSELADALDMDRTTLTRNLRPLLDAGWVEVGTSAQDARMRVVHITSSGEAQLQTARAYWRRAQAEVNSTVGQREVAALHELLDRYLPLFRPADGETE